MQFYFDFELIYSAQNMKWIVWFLVLQNGQFLTFLLLILAIVVVCVFNVFSEYFCYLSLRFLPGGISPVFTYSRSFSPNLSFRTSRLFLFVSTVLVFAFLRKLQCPALFFYQLVSTMLIHKKPKK